MSDERLRFRKGERILRRGDFLRVQRLGHKVQTPSFVIMLLPAEQTRLGITVTRKTAGAVGRNRIKRLVREVYRRNRPLFPERCELVLLARRGAPALDYASLRAELSQASAQLHRVAVAAHAHPREPRA